MSRTSRPLLLLAIAGPLAVAPRIALAQGMDPAALEGLRQRIVSGELPNVHSLLAIQGGKPVIEWYFAGEDEIRGQPTGHVAFNAASLHDLRSVTKSVVALLAGIALQEGAIESLDVPVLDFFPEYADLRTSERLKIRLRDLLSMTAGLAWDEDSYPYTDPRNSETAMDLAGDRYRYALEQRIVAAPGTTFTYSGGNVALVAEVIRRTTRTPVDAYAEAKLFHPLGITKFAWLKDPSGTPLAASGLRLRPADMAKIGQLMLDGGRFGDQQIVSASWVEAAASSQVALGPESCALGYGYFWWISPGCITDPPTPWFGAIGNGGQRIWVVPSRRLVVVMTEGLYNRKQTNATEILRSVLTAPPLDRPR